MAVLVQFNSKSLTCRACSGMQMLDYYFSLRTQLMSLVTMVNETKIAFIQCMWEEPGQPCRIHTYTVYTSIGGKGKCHTRGESEESVVCRWGSMQVRESTLVLKPRADVTRSSKQGYQWPHKKDLCPTKFFKKIAFILKDCRGGTKWDPESDVQVNCVQGLQGTAMARPIWKKTYRPTSSLSPMGLSIYRA